MDTIIPYALKFSWDETFMVFSDLKSCMKILSLRKFRLRSCTMTKMAVKRTGVVKKHCSAYALFFIALYPQTNEVYVNKGLTKGRIKEESMKIQTLKIMKIGISRKFSSCENLGAYDIQSIHVYLTSLTILKFSAVKQSSNSSRGSISSEPPKFLKIACSNCLWLTVNCTSSSSLSRLLSRALFFISQ